MKKVLINLLKKAHYRAPLWAKAFYMPLISLARYLQSLYVDSYIISGTAKKLGIKLCIAYYGNDIRIMNYWTNMLFEEDVELIKSPKTPIWKIGNKTSYAESDPDLRLVVVARFTKRIMKAKTGFFLPRWFETNINVEKTLDALDNNETHKHMNKYGFTCEQRTTKDDLKFFYERMFKPYILDRHKSSSVMYDFSYFSKRYNKKDSTLFFLMKDGEPVGGSFNQRVNGKIKFSGLGILDGNKDIVRMGAIRVMYYYMLSFYKESKIDEIKFGGTCPLLSDGLTQFKISMRAFPDKRTLLGEKSIWLTPLHKSDTVKEVLGANPFIFVKQNKIYRAVFLDTSKIQDGHQLKKQLKRTHYRNLAGTILYCWDNTEKTDKWMTEAALTECTAKTFQLGST